MSITDPNPSSNPQAPTETSQLELDRLTQEMSSTNEAWIKKALIVTACTITIFAVVAGMAMVFQDKIKPDVFFGTVQTILAALLAYSVGHRAVRKSD
jgi:hypothetical protein